MSRGAAEFVLKLIDQVSPGFHKIAGEATAALDKMDDFTASLDSVGKNAINISSLQDVLENAAGAMNDMSEPGILLDTQMKELSAITGVVGDNLEVIEGNARAAAKAFGTEAADQVNSYKLILSQLTPEIAKDAEALSMMGRNVGLLSKTMSGDAIGATEALTVAMNQYGVDLANPIKAAQSMHVMMDMMAAAARVGSAEVPDLAASIKVSGLTAKNAGVEFAEFNAAIETLALGQIKGAEAGTALRNVLLIMGKQEWLPPQTLNALRGAGVDVTRLADTTIPLANRLTELKKIQGDTALVQALFGRENQNAALQLIGNIDVMREYTAQIQNSNGATAQMAATVMSSYGEKMNRVKSFFKDLGIDVFAATKEYLPFLQVSVYGLDLYTRMAPIFTLAKGALVTFVQWMRVGIVSVWRFVMASGATALSLARTAATFLISAVTAIGSFIFSIASATASMIGLNIAMYANPIGLIIAGIVALIAVVAVVIVFWDDLKVYFIDFAEFMIKLNPFYWLIELVDFILPGTKQAIIDFFTGIWDWVSEWVGKIVDKIGEMFGTISSSEVSLGQLDMPADQTKDYKMNFKTTNVQQDIVESTKKESTVRGGEGKARIVNVKIDNPVFNNIFESNSDSELKNLEDKFARFIIGAVRDAEVILSNG